jgi:hypothetical protein
MRHKSSTFVGLLFFIALGWTGLSAGQGAPAVAEPAAKGPKVTLQSLAAQVATLTQTVQTETQTVQTLTQTVQGLQSQLASANAQNAFALGQFVTVDTKDTINGLKPPHIIFSGGNLHVQSGSGKTLDDTGLGNLVVGYDEDSVCLAVKAATIDANRGGSHNLIAGDCHQFTNSAGFIAGFDNTVANNYASVSGGSQNQATAVFSTVCGGAANVASANAASITGGEENDAKGDGSSVSGGHGNVAIGAHSSISGGGDNGVTGDSSSIARGNNNSVSGKESFIGGGQGQTITGDHLFN